MHSNVFIIYELSSARQYCNVWNVPKSQNLIIIHQKSISQARSEKYQVLNNYVDGIILTWKLEYTQVLVWSFGTKPTLSLGVGQSGG